MFAHLCPVLKQANTKHSCQCVILLAIESSLGFN